MKTIILGAGVTGLAAAHKTGGTIYEANNVAGGLCRSYYKRDYRFEVGGGHWIFGADEETVNFMHKFAYFKTYKRNAGVYINNIYPYPIQKHFEDIPEFNTDTMKEWLYQKFGPDLCSLFFYPFNERYTAGLYNHIAPQDTHKNPIHNQGYNAEFIYPENGLTNFINTMANGLDIKYNKQVCQIYPNIKKVTFIDGSSVEYDRLISTLPLNKMAQYLDMGKELPYNSTMVLNIGATKGKNCPSEHWLYTPYSKAGFHRVGFYSNVDKSFAPKNRVAIYVEWAYLKERPLLEPAIKELQSWGFIKKVDCIDSHNIDIAYTWEYPKSNIKADLLYLINNYGITQIGRYGRWHFQGIAQNIKEGLSC
jgi:protoporphyrinogen oxidase